MKKKMSTNVIAYWQKELERINVFLVLEDQIEHLRRS